VILHQNILKNQAWAWGTGHRAGGNEVKCSDHFNQSQAQVTSWPVLREEEREEGREEGGGEGDSDYKT
jgi:hypothetical protein